MSVPPSPGAPIAQMQNPVDEASALQKITWFGILELAEIVVGLVLSFYLLSAFFFSPFFLNPPTSLTAAQAATIFEPLFRTLALILPITIALGLAAVVVLTLSFRQFTKVDRSRFSTPSTMTILMIIGLAAVTVGAIPIFYGLGDLIVQLTRTQTGNPAQSYASFVGSFIFFGALIGIGGLLALVGMIGGVILGLWRVGVRYDQTVIKVGAIFIIIPFLNFVAPALILIGAHDAKGSWQCLADTNHV